MTITRNPPYENQPNWFTDRDAYDAEVKATANAAESAAAAAAATAASVQTALGNKVNTSTYTAGMAAKADLVGGVIPNSQLPPLAITDVFPVASESAMLALTAQRGDVAIRTDTNTAFILRVEPASTLANWVSFGSATSGVTSVAGKTGVVALVTADITGLQALLDAKAGFASPGADRIMFWDQSANGWAPLSLNTGLSITGTVLSVTRNSVEYTGSAWPADPNPGGVTFWLSTKNADAQRPTAMKTGDIWISLGTAQL